MSQDPLPIGYCRRHLAMNDDHLVHPNAWWTVDLTPALLRTSKRVYQEAASILYGSNRFSFETVICVDSWFKRIGPNVRYIEHIHLDYLSRSASVSDLSALLRPAKNLKSLPWNFIPSFRPEAVSSKAFADGVHGLVETLAEKRGLEDVLRILKCREEHHPRCKVIGHGVKEGECQVERAEAYCEDVKRLLRRRLEGRWFAMLELRVRE